MALMSSFLQGGEVVMALIMSSNFLQGGEVFMALMSYYLVFMALMSSVGRSSWL